MSTGILHQVVRQLQNRFAAAFPSVGSTRLLFVTSERQAVARSQIFPFRYFRHELSRRRIDSREISIDAFDGRGRLPRDDADVVLLQPWYDIEAPRLRAVLAAIRSLQPTARIVFLDSFAPLDLRLAQYVGNDVDLYVKKHVFRDRSQYGRATKGHTNLMDHFGTLYGFNYEETLYPIPDGFLKKLVVGPTFATGEHLLPIFEASPRPISLPDRIDLHARLGGLGINDWYGRMRDHAQEVVRGLRGLRVVSEGLVDRHAYMRELRQSKICFSPFGYGEICWRDYEAVACGSLLVKPDVSHVETDPDIFRPFETYVPLRWDLADLEEKVRHYLGHESERAAIACRAYSILHDYFANAGFLQHAELVAGSRPCV